MITRPTPGPHAASAASDDRTGDAERAWLALGIAALAGFVLITFAVAAKVPIPLDESLLAAAARLTDYLPDWRFLSDSANLPLIAIGIGIVVWMLRAGRRREAALVVVALVLVTAGSEAVKLLVARPRPPHADVSVLGVVYSYPSGHVLEAMTIYGIIGITMWRSRMVLPMRVAVIAALLVLVALVAVARVALQAHYPSDVVAGALAGMGVVAIYAGLTLRGARRRAETRPPARRAAGPRVVPLADDLAMAAPTRASEP